MPIKVVRRRKSGGKFVLHVSVFERNSVYCSSKSVESVKPAKFSSLYDKKVLRGVQLSSEKSVSTPLSEERGPLSAVPTAL